MINFLNNFKNLNLTDRELNEYSPLVLAYIGDTVYEVFIRTYLVVDREASVNTLHKRATSYVKASAQSKIVHSLTDKLTEEEKNIVRRGRNAKSGTIPKNANVTEYKYATGFEALIGYLFLKKDYERLSYIIEEAIKVQN